MSGIYRLAVSHLVNYTEVTGSILSVNPAQIVSVTKCTGAMAGHFFLTLVGGQVFYVTERYGKQGRVIDAGSAEGAE